MKYIILKEFLKIRFAFFAFLICALGICVAIIFGTNGQILTNSAARYISSVVFKMNFSFIWLDIANIFFTLLIGVFAFFPERLNGRIRIQFHFPHSDFTNILTTVLIPLCFVIFVFLCEFIILKIYLNLVFPKNLNYHMITILFNNFAFCITLFLAAPSFLIEPNLRRIVGFIIAQGLLIYIYFKINPDFINLLSYGYNGEFSKFFIFCLIFAIISLVLSFFDYKQGYIK
ncbi:MAG: hypothetical protein IJ211_00370 [Campylobacter sp.]|nr:hypothetical protein [Campylobacter sp.]